jgi:tRNA (guanine-N7-)-methyltransferase
MPRVRVHQHVNPLSPHFTFIPKPLKLEEIFLQPDLALHLDIGCARGRFLLKMAEIEPQTNFLGLEIRELLVVEASRIAQEHGLQNLHYEFVNATLGLQTLLEDIPPNLLQTVSIQFPDPWYKKKHAKRRMVKDKMVATIMEKLAVSGKIVLQTDVEFLAEEMFHLSFSNKN